MIYNITEIEVFLTMFGDTWYSRGVWTRVIKSQIKVVKVLKLKKFTSDWTNDFCFVACAYDSRATLIRTIHILKNIEFKNVESRNVESNNVECKKVECLLDVRDVIEGMLGRDNDQSVVKIPELEHLVSILTNFRLSTLSKKLERFRITCKV